MSTIPENKVDPGQFDEDDPRLLQVSREYLSELEAGGSPDKQAYLSRYPELTDALLECLEGIELAHSLRPMNAPTPVEFHGSPLGDFQIIREIGRGGMGVVYEAIQISLGRHVALKVLPFAAALDARQLQRFKNEAHAAAQLHHTNIVPVYAVGCDRGVHFYAMQLIEGRSLASAIKELRNDFAAAPTAFRDSETRQNPTATQANSAALTQRTRRGSERFRTAARMAAQVADALEYAHDAGVVHRDIKPANLMLDTRGAVWITDFGLAQVVADAGVTQTGDLVGTLRYMSPEQAAGRKAPIDHRTDVYSLGATLYEVLTLQPIFTGEDRVGLLQQILNDDPRPLRSIDPSIPVELETIVLKATSKSASDRYATAGEMAADLRRYLDERPILARRPSLVDHVRKWMRRHPSFVGAAVILLVCGVIGLAITTALVSHEQALTRQAYERESQRLKEAEHQFELARRAADEMIRLAEEELSDNPFQERLRKRLLETALGYYQEFIAEREERPTAQAELSVTRDRVKRILADLAVLHADRHNFLLRESAVLDDLGLTPEQREQLTAVAEVMEKHRRELGGGPHDFNSNEHRKRMLDVARDNEAALATILSPAQLKRLPQIALQSQGPRGLHEPDVSSSLKLTPEQRDQMNRIEAEMAPFRFEPGHRGPSPESHEDLARKTVQKMLTVLTDQQRSKWQELTGKPYNGPLMIPRRSGPGPGFGPGQGPGYGRPGQPDNRPGFGPPGSPNRFNPGPPGDRGPEGAPRPRPKSNGNNPPDDRQ